MVPGGTQQEDEADCHKQRRRGDDGVDPVAEGVGQIRHPVGQSVVVIYWERIVQNKLHSIGILHRTHAGTLGILPVIGNRKLPRAIRSHVCSAAPDLPLPLGLHCCEGDVPPTAEPLRRLLVHPIGQVCVVPGDIARQRVPVSPGDIGKQLLLEGRLAGGIDICLIQERRPQNAAGCHGGHHHQQQKGHDLGYGALRQLCLASGSPRDRRGDLLRHRLGDLLFDMRFHGFHVRIPFSSLYPWPQTTFKYRGSAGLISSFSRRWRMWTATVFSLPKGASFHTFR